MFLELFWVQFSNFSFYAHSEPFIGVTNWKLSRHRTEMTRLTRFCGSKDVQKHGESLQKIIRPQCLHVKVCRYCRLCQIIHLDTHSRGGGVLIALSHTDVLGKQACIQCSMLQRHRKAEKQSYRPTKCFHTLVSVAQLRLDVGGNARCCALIPAEANENKGNLSAPFHLCQYLESFDVKNNNSRLEKPNSRRVFSWCLIITCFDCGITGQLLFWPQRFHGGVAGVAFIIK